MGGLVFKSWRWLTLTWQTPHYHQREEVSLLSSGRDQVVHSCYCRQQTVVVFWGLIDHVVCTSCLPYLLTKEFNGLDYWVCIVTSFITKSSLVWIELSIYTPTVWVLYSQASRAISIGQLHASLHFHIQPINVVVFNGSLEDIKSLGNLILR